MQTHANENNLLSNLDLSVEKKNPFDSASVDRDCCSDYGILNVLVDCICNLRAVSSPFLPCLWHPALAIHFYTPSPACLSVLTREGIKRAEKCDCARWRVFPQGCPSHLSSAVWLPPHRPRTHSVCAGDVGRGHAPLGPGLVMCTEDTPLQARGWQCGQGTGSLVKPILVSPGSDCSSVIPHCLECPQTELASVYFQ